MRSGRGRAIDRTEWPRGGSHRQLLELLDGLHLKAGTPSLSQLVGGMSIDSRTRVSHILRGHAGALPADSLQLAELVEALGGDAETVHLAQGLLPGALREVRSVGVRTADRYAPWAEQIDESLARFANRRTAHPIDMTLKQIVSQRLVVNTPIWWSREGRPQSRKISQAALLGQLSTSAPSILLGESGAGKTMVAYQLAAKARSAGRPAIVMAAQQVPDEAEALLSTGRGRSDLPVIIVDGLDEGLSQWRKRGGIPANLGRLLTTYPSLATARTRAFEESSELDAAGIWFDSIFTIAPWTIETHFARYVDLLVSKGRLPDHALLTAAQTSPQVARLASRPLHARMLAFLFESGDHDLDAAASESTLYSAYIQKLSSVAERGQARRGCPSPPTVLDVWTDEAWSSYSGEQRPSEVAGCKNSALEYISDDGQLGPGTRREYLHYSLFEWLVARKVLDGIANNPRDHRQLFEVLKLDLPREVRHFLVGMLRPLTRARTDQLTEAYWSIRRDNGLDERGRLLANNLLIYLIGRASSTAVSALRGIVEQESDEFLLNSAQWAMAHLGSIVELEKFAHSYNRSEQWRMISRGYTLYYYGDISAEEGPPYLDRHPYVLCEKAVDKVVEMLLDEQYAKSVPLERQVVDALIVFDIMRVRGNSMSNKQLLAAQTMIHRMTDADVVPVAVELVSDCVSELLLIGGDQ